MNKKCLASPVLVDAVLIKDIVDAAKIDEYESMPVWVRRALDDGRLVINAKGVAVERYQGEILYGKMSDYLVKGLNNDIITVKSTMFSVYYSVVDYKSLNKQFREESGVI